MAGDSSNKKGTITADQVLIGEWIDRVDALQEQEQRSLDEEELKSIALELGVEPEEIAQADTLAQQAWDLGQSFATKKRWNAAIDKLEEANRWRPLTPGLLTDLAHAHAERWHQTGVQSDHDDAQRYATRALALDTAFERAKHVKDRLKENRDLTIQSTTQRPWMRLAMVAVTAGLLFLVGDAGMRVLRPYYYTADKSGDGPVDFATVANPDFGGSYDLPTTQGEIPDSLDLVLTTSHFRGGIDSLSWETRGRVSLNSNIPTSSGPSGLNVLVVKLSALDVNSRVVATKVAEIVPNHHTPLHPGDTYPFYVRVGASPVPEGVGPPVRGEVTLVDMQWVRREGQSKGKKIEPRWLTSQPDDIDIEVRLRLSESKPSLTKYTSQAVFSVTNIGSQPIQSLKTEIVFEDDSGTRVDSFERNIALNIWPALLTGERRIVSGKSLFKPEPLNPVLVITEIK